jgi:hypothetical protein
MVGVMLGCGSGPTLVKVTGKVTRNGQPVPNAMIHFQPEKGRQSLAITDEQGQYELRYDKTRKGAVPGTYKVYVEFKPKTPQEENLMARGEWKLSPDQEAILEKYGSKSEAPPLEIEVGREDNQEIPIKLD